MAEYNELSTELNVLEAELKSEVNKAWEMYNAELNVITSEITTIMSESLDTVASSDDGTLD